MTIASIIAAAGTEIAYPLKSIDFESSSSQRLQLSNANFGSYDRTKCSWSFWINPESDNGYITTKSTGGSDYEFKIRLSSGQINVFFLKSGGVVNGSGLATTTSIPNGSFAHVQIDFDEANGTSANRIKILINGVTQTIDSYVAPTAALQTTTAPVNISSEDSTGNNFFDGLIYQMAFFSGVNPSNSSLYNNGHPRDIRLVSGLYSLLDVAGSSVTSDYLLSGWTQTNTPVASSSIPT